MRGAPSWSSDPELRVKTVQPRWSAGLNLHPWSALGLPLVSGSEEAAASQGGPRRACLGSASRPWPLRTGSRPEVAFWGTSGFGPLQEPSGEEGSGAFHSGQPGAASSGSPGGTLGIPSRPAVVRPSHLGHDTFGVNMPLVLGPWMSGWWVGGGGGVDKWMDRWVGGWIDG